MQWWERRGRFLSRYDDGFGRYHRCVLSMTGLGRRMASIVVDVSQRNIDLALVLTMLVAIILGMGMPSVAAYTAVSGNLLPLVSVCFKSFNTNGDFPAIRRAAAWSLSLGCLSAPVYIQKLLRPTIKGIRTHSNFRTGWGRISFLGGAIFLRSITPLSRRRRLHRQRTACSSHEHHFFVLVFTPYVQFVCNDRVAWDL